MRDHGAPDPPAPLRSAAYPGAAKLGRGQGYDYPHDHPEGVSEQELMPAEAEGERFLELSEHGEEAAMRERLERIRKRPRRLVADRTSAWRSAAAATDVSALLSGIGLKADTSATVMT